jgi:hypothetical protein
LEVAFALRIPAAPVAAGTPPHFAMKARRRVILNPDSTEELTTDEH